jgi:hypothetical protein
MQGWLWRLLEVLEGTVLSATSTLAVLTGGFEVEAGGSSASLAASLGFANHKRKGCQPSKSRVFHLEGKGLRSDLAIL